MDSELEDDDKQIDPAVKKSFPDIEVLDEQRTAMKAVVYHRKDIMALLPTGYGKSLIYQVLPNLHQIRNDKSRIAIVVTPLNAIIEQQTEELK